MRTVLVLSVALLAASLHQEAMAWTWTPHPNAGAAPHVSGHSAVTNDDKILLFGGLTGNAGSPCTKDLWTFNGEWKHVDTASGPGPMMYSAAAVLNNDLYLMGGWDPGEPKSGGVFLDDVWRLDGKSLKWELMKEKLPCGPVSRHAGCTVGNQIVLHTFRGICTFDGKKWKEQETTGEGPEGLSMCSMTPLSDSSLLVFGGSTKTQQLSSDAFVLDTITWEWTKLDVGEDEGPSARASPCAAKCADHQAVIFGGASLASGGYEGGAGLQAQDDTWLLTVGDNHKASWDRIDFSDAGPGARLAASLSPTSEAELVLQGGWDPKGETFEDTWVLTKDE